MSVKEWRSEKGNKIQRQKYAVLREIGVGANKANEMKQWGLGRINRHLLSKEIETLPVGTIVMFTNGKGKIARIVGFTDVHYKVFDGSTQRLVYKSEVSELGNLSELPSVLNRGG